MRTISLLLVSLLSITYSTASYAGWSLENQLSTLNFMSTKNQHITESHSFTQFSGSLDDSGRLEVTVELKSVETNIPIRNERMQEHLFEVNTSPSAKLVAQVPKAVLSMAAGETRSISLDTKITIKNVTADYPVQVRVTKDKDGRLVATTIKPIMIQAPKHGLVSGLGVLKEIAGLKSIGFTVPVYFSVVFSK
ncbi:YceI family protein [Aliiglaciecola litoralis]|uniref:Lipid/polyisoprenoid-binding YceI-like domain-containing protein n=1 Tax=Aliiglaciecola litoralis TaxID=582857 RepID=A0ABN1LG74_9ALTE